jgi:diaminohydroxyphosphoribosylaminopyrimidine deaminase/5-amino-6-(5-phosphoribosylamino)uracil reductase
VLDRALRTPADARVLAGRSATMVVCAPGSSRARKRRIEAVGAEVIELQGTASGVWKPLLRELGRRGLHELLIEGGGRVAASALGARVVKGLTFFYNPRILGADGVPMIGPLGIDDPASAIRVSTRHWTMSGEDLVWHGIVE